MKVLKRLFKRKKYNNEDTKKCVFKETAEKIIVNKEVKKNIVLVDDYVEFLEILSEFIEKSNNAKCITFSNPCDALSCISSLENVDLVITDYEMPRMNGFELSCELLKLNPTLKIIIHSGNDEKYLKAIRSKYNLDDKVEITTKSNLEYYKNLF